MVQYWVSVLLKGIQDSLDFVQQSKNGIIFALLVLLLTALWLSKKHGWRDAMTNLWRTAGEGLVITIIAWVLVLCGHLIYEPFHLQYDERERTTQAVATLGTVSNKLLLCGANLNGANEKIELLGRQITAQQTQIAGQQTLITGQHATSATQQSTFDLCVTTLTKANAPTPQATTMLKVEDPSDPQAKHTALLLLLTNKPVTPVRLIIWCDGAPTKADFMPFGEVAFSGGIQPLNSGALFLAPKRWQINMSFPAWAPEQPLLVKLSHDMDNLGSCYINL